MGAGKTSVGRALGQRLNWFFEDLDDRIEKTEGRTVTAIFRDSGEQSFRRAERAALEQVLGELAGGMSRVVALGGGAFAQPDNVSLLRASSVPIIFLDAPVEELWQRCSRQARENGVERPLLRSIEQFRELYDTRRAGYAKALLKIETGGRTVQAIVAAIAQALDSRTGLKKADLKNLAGKNPAQAE
jgi:shikimate kinase